MKHKTIWDIETVRNRPKNGALDPVATERRVSFWQLMNRPKEGLTLCSLLVGGEEWQSSSFSGGVFIEKRASPNEWQIFMESRS